VDKNEEMHYLVVVIGVAIALMVFPFTRQINMLCVVIGMLAAVVVYGTLETWGGPWRLGTMTTFIVLPFWYWVSQGMEGNLVLFCGSVGMYFGIGGFLLFHYEQLKIKDGGPGKDLKVYPFIFTIALALLFVYLAPIEVERTEVAFLSLVFGVFLLFFMVRLGVDVGRPLMAFTVIFPILIIIYWPPLIYEVTINAAIVAGLLGALAGYVANSFE